MPRKFTDEEAREIALSKGFKIDDAFVYTRAHSKLEGTWIECNHRGTPLLSSLRADYKCRVCAGQYIPTTEEAKEKFLTKGFKVDDNYIYTGVSQKVTGKWLECGHEGTPRLNNILRGKKCFICNRKLNRRNKQNEVYRKCLDYGFKLDIDCIYQGNKQLLKGTWEKCGHRGTPSFNGLQRGYGCVICSKHYIPTLEEVRKKCLRYNFILDENYIYKTMHTKLHGKWQNCNHIGTPTLTNLQHGTTCNICNSSGYNTGRPGTLYYIYFTESNLYKFGITNRTIKQRFLCYPSYIIIHEEKWEDGIVAKQKETQIKETYRDLLYKGRPLLPNGNTECSRTDILGLHNAEIKSFDFI